MKIQRSSGKNGSRFLPLALLLLLVACAPAKNVGLDNENRVFTPAAMLPLKVAIAVPLVPPTHVKAHQALQSWDESPGKRRLLMRCTWQDGLENLVTTMVPGTEILFLGEGKNPLMAVGVQVAAESDSLGRVVFTLEGRSALDVAQHQGWSHLVVLRQLEYDLKDNDPKELFLVCPAAIVDVQEQRIVWQGSIDSRRVSSGSLGARKEGKPALTIYEETTYRFILNLVEIFGRQLNPAPESRNDLALPCQKRPPLLDQE